MLCSPLPSHLRAWQEGASTALSIECCCESRNQLWRAVRALEGSKGAEGQGAHNGCPGSAWCRPERPAGEGMRWAVKGPKLWLITNSLVMAHQATAAERSNLSTAVCAWRHESRLTKAKGPLSSHVLNDACCVHAPYAKSMPSRFAAGAVLQAQGQKSRARRREAEPGQVRKLLSGHSRTRGSKHSMSCTLWSPRL